MTSYVIDAGAALELARGGFAGPAEGDRLLAPTLLRSQTLALAHEAVAGGELAAAEARALLDRIDGWPVRLLGDRKLRGTAWTVADELGWASTYDAEYVALTRLHGDALVTARDDLADRLAGVVETVPVARLL